jgi:hypothetical protein
MHQGLTQIEAVRQAKENLPEATAQEIAAYVQEKYGLTIKPPIVTVILGTFQERAALTSSGLVASEQIERWKAENPEEAKKLAALAKRRATAKKKKEARAGAAEAAALDPPSVPG